MAELLGFIFLLFVIASPFLVLYALIKAYKRRKLKPKKGRKVESIKDIFFIDLYNFNEGDYREKKRGESEGKPFIDFVRKLRKKECGMFDSVTARVFPEAEEIHYMFFIPNIKAVNPESLRYLVNSLTTVYGEDNSGKGYLTQEEMKELKQPDVFWPGRNWFDLNNFTSVKLEAYHDEGLTLAISIVSHTEKVVEEAVEAL